MDSKEFNLISAKLGVLAAQKYGKDFAGKSRYGRMGEATLCQDALAESLGYKTLSKFIRENPTAASDLVANIGGQ